MSIGSCSRVAFAGLLAIVGFTACSGSGGATSRDVARLPRPAPSFQALDQASQMRTLEEFRGRTVILYFYPRDATPGCTREACAFRDAWERLEQAGAQVLGVSTDDVSSHRAFAEEHGLPFPLLADTDAAIARAYGVPVSFGAARRMTFLIDGRGQIRKVFEDVDPAVHAGEVIEAIAEL